MTAIGEIGFEQQQQQQEYVDDAQLMEELAQKRVRAMGRIAIMMKKMRLEREANIKRIEAKSAYYFCCANFPLTLVQRTRSTTWLSASILRTRSVRSISESVIRRSN